VYIALDVVIGRTCVIGRIIAEQQMDNFRTSYYNVHLYTPTGRTNIVFRDSLRMRPGDDGLKSPLPGPR